MLASFTEIVGVWVAALLTLATLSFIFKDNPLYRLAEHIVVGVSAGYTLVQLVSTSLNDLLVKPLGKLLGGGGALASSQGLLDLLLLLVPLTLGILMVLRLFPRTAWLGRYSLALFIGVGSGLAIPTYIQTFVVQPLRATFIPVLPTSVAGLLLSVVGLEGPAGSATGWVQAINNLVIVVGTFCGIVYFFFSKEHKGLTGKAANFGIWILMVGFGSTFGFTVMSRVSLLVARFEFLIHDWILDNFWRLLFPK